MTKRRELAKVVKTNDELRFALRWAQEMAGKALAAGPVQITLGRQRRSLDQNAKLWPMLTDISRQVDWYGQKLTPEDWKHVLTAGLKKQRAVPGIDGGFVVLGLSTSRMTKEVFSQLIELIFAFGSEHGVEWSDQSNQNLYDLRNAA
ncbi:recombination protein NinB [Marinobacter nauticus]|uniref:recombination protein NinB n=1 Tax=Marinobacter nauticus TaxID=2743 RepID=UPI001C9A2200|nr:recombination protein NinB [Marinobacter nauticus]MBY5961914.1 recombination protein NinB [Marinobacter nauticus]